MAVPFPLPLDFRRTSQPAKECRMISRIVTCNVRPEKLTEFRNTLNQQLLPRIQKQHGFVDVVESIDTTTGTFVCNTFWNTRQDVETYENSLFQEVSKALTPF